MSVVFANQSLYFGLQAVRLSGDHLLDGFKEAAILLVSLHALGPRLELRDGADDLVQLSETFVVANQCEHRPALLQRRDGADVEGTILPAGFSHPVRYVPEVLAY